jgi:hypothetical protein
MPLLMARISPNIRPNQAITLDPHPTALIGKNLSPTYNKYNVFEINL